MKIATNFNLVMYTTTHSQSIGDPIIPYLTAASWLRQLSKPSINHNTWKCTWSNTIHSKTWREGKKVEHMHLCTLLKCKLHKCSHYYLYDAALNLDKAPWRALTRKVGHAPHGWDLHLPQTPNVYTMHIWWVQISTLGDPRLQEYQRQIKAKHKPYGRAKACNSCYIRGGHTGLKTPVSKHR